MKKHGRSSSLPFDTCECCDYYYYYYYYYQREERKERRKVYIWSSFSSFLSSVLMKSLCTSVVAC